MTYITMKERQTNGSLFEKTWAWKVKNILMQKIGCLSKYKYYDNIAYSSKTQLLNCVSIEDNFNRNEI